jgi:UDP-glucose 4-epimerase
MRIIVAGASGFIGGRLCSYLANKGYEIVALVNKNVPNDQIWCGNMYSLVEIDLSSADQITKLEQYEPDVIINLVSLDHIYSNGDIEYVNKVNVLPSWNLLKHFSEKGLKKFIYLSTIHVYGNQLNGLITEKSDLLPVTPYGLTHLLSENIVTMFAGSSNTDCYIIRFSNGFGAPQFIENKCWDLIINNLCLSVWENQTLILRSDGSPMRDFINMTDLLIGIECILLKIPRNTKKVDKFNFSSSETISMLDAAIQVKDIYEKKYNRKANLYINGNEQFNSYQKLKSSKYKIDNSAFVNLLGDNKLHDLSFGIHEIFNFLDSRK